MQGKAGTKSCRSLTAFQLAHLVTGLTVEVTSKMLRSEAA